jgi:hypothetical protein
MDRGSLMADIPVAQEIVVTAPPAAPPRRVRPYRPQFSVILKKSVLRTQVAQDVNVSSRVNGLANQEIDLAQFLGEGNAVTVRRSVRGGDSGSFSIQFPDQMSRGQLESFYGLVEPMDVIEIRMARSPTGAGGSAALPVVLRGFVSQVSRDEVMTNNGPQRVVAIAGHDYMKLLQIMRVIYLPTMIVGQDLLTPMNLFLNYGVDAKNYVTAADFVKEVLEKTVQPFIGRLQGATGSGSSPVEQLQLGINVSPADSSNVSPFGTQSWAGGTIYDLLAQFGDVGPWQELYVSDEDDGPKLNYRPTPFKDATGAMIQADAAADSVTIDAADVMELHASRSDDDVGNYFWVDAPRYQLIGSPILQQDQNLDPAPDLTSYQNCDPKIYGTRLLRVSSNQGGRYDGQSEAGVTQGDQDAVDMVNQKRRILIENNKDNVVLETGYMRVKGDETIKPGMYVKVRRNAFTASYYAHTVTQTFVFGGVFTTTIEFDRGTGFLERVQREGTASPYLSEVGRGVYAS